MPMMKTPAAPRGPLLRRLALGTGLVAVIAALLVGTLRQTNAAAPPPPMTITDFQGMIFVWASGTPEVQELAASQCRALRLTASQCAAVSATTRAAWLNLLARDPAALGRVGTRPNLAARGQILRDFTLRLGRVTVGHTTALLGATRASYGQLRDPQFARQAARRIGKPIPIGGARTVWATAYAQTQLPPGIAHSGKFGSRIGRLYWSRSSHTLSRSYK